MCIRDSPRPFPWPQPYGPANEAREFSKIPSSPSHGTENKKDVSASFFIFCSGKATSHPAGIWPSGHPLRIKRAWGKIGGEASLLSAPVKGRPSSPGGPQGRAQPRSPRPSPGPAAPACSTWPCCLLYTSSAALRGTGTAPRSFPAAAYCRPCLRDAQKGTRLFHLERGAFLFVPSMPMPRTRTSRREGLNTKKPGQGCCPPPAIIHDRHGNCPAPETGKGWYCYQPCFPLVPKGRVELPLRCQN